MPLVIFRAARYPSADREKLALAALDFCRSAKSLGDVSSRFYWIEPNTIGFVFQAGSHEPLNRLTGTSPEPPDAGVEIARFALADLAQLSIAERWMEPAAGEVTYRAAGR